MLPRDHCHPLQLILRAMTIMPPYCRYYSNVPVIFLGVGPITTVYSDAVLDTIALTQSKYNMSNVHYLNMSGAALDGCDSHPGIIGHQQMAAMARPQILAVMGWASESSPLASSPESAELEEDVTPVGYRAPDDNRIAADYATNLERKYAAAEAAGASIRQGRAAASLQIDHGSAVSRDRASPTGDITLVVRSDGSGQFTSVQAALDFCNSTTDPTLGHVLLDIQGRFYEQVYVESSFSAGVSFVGTGAAPQDALITFDRPGGLYSTWYSQTVMVQARNVTIINMALANNAANYNSTIAGQSVALHVDVTADQFSCWSCELLGAQDTIYTGGAGEDGRGQLRHFSVGSCPVASRAGDTIDDGHSRLTGQLCSPHRPPLHSSFRHTSRPPTHLLQATVCAPTSTPPTLMARATRGSAGPAPCWSRTRSRWISRCSVGGRHVCSLCDGSARSRTLLILLQHRHLVDVSIDPRARRDAAAPRGDSTHAYLVLDSSLTTTNGVLLGGCRTPSFPLHRCQLATSPARRCCIRVVAFPLAHHSRWSSVDGAPVIAAAFALSFPLQPGPGVRYRRSCSRTPSWARALTRLDGTVGDLLTRFPVPCNSVLCRPFGSAILIARAHAPCSCTCRLGRGMHGEALLVVPVPLLR